MMRAIWRSALHYLRHLRQILIALQASEAQALANTSASRTASRYWSWISIDSSRSTAV
ncbi:MAG: hypothetical protein GPOALKHO_000660 [Sodalis sp.]|nr:MAG: hypothetical protein GPOALKHO_000660 [Sodalis sp.]